MLPIAASTAGPRRREQKKHGPIDADRVLANISPIPAPRSPEWKKATDYLVQEKEWSLEQASAPEGGPVSPLIRGSILHRCLEEYAKDGKLRIARPFAAEFPAVRVLSGKKGKVPCRRGPVVRSRHGERRTGMDIPPSADGILRTTLPVPERERDRERHHGPRDRQGRTGVCGGLQGHDIENDEALQSLMDHYRPQAGSTW